MTATEIRQKHEHASTYLNTDSDIEIRTTNTSTTHQTTDTLPIDQYINNKENKSIPALPTITNNTARTVETYSNIDDNNPEHVYSMYPDEQNLRKEVTRASEVASSLNLPENFEIFLEDNDPENLANNFSLTRKYYITILVSATSMIITILSSCWTFVSPKVMEKFHLGHEVGVLGISLFIFGLGVGPLFLSPLSELYGRKPTFILSLFMLICWEILTAWSKTYAGIMLGRFLSGFFGSAFLSVAGGVLTDILSRSEITIPMMIYSLSPFLGPAIGPILGAAFYHDDYEWTFVVLLIATGVSFVLLIVTLPETYKPLLLIKKAKRIRTETGDERYYAPLEISRKETSILSAVLLSVKRPFGLLLFDPMMGVLCFYTGLELAIVYLFFVAFPYIYKKLYRMTPAEIGCTYLGLAVGMIIIAPTTFILQKRYLQRVKDNDGKSVPEFRFEPLFYGAFLSPMGLMIFAWTCYSHVHWIGSIIGAGVFGSGVFYIFNGVFGYTVDAYRLYAATGMACNSFVRSFMSGVFPLFGLQMYERMGINWAGFFLSCLNILMIPVPFLFNKYGAYLRSKSPYSWDDEDT
ncbi:MFS transporter SCDLUD_004844 [Saccharomycodes ludwigii]|uniref:MFS transporter n=1 Tax=Saccharomycodes ludwigii TaxID=36035 RepID=UPI001E83E3E9|nr:hypothetical protein SCDLUD_004844 [Saccharomycodes ludwigii]KAH3899401.1 hypothetical protein SCDLUD_004844 [Saccharomycodes ludwigii]